VFDAKLTAVLNDESGETAAKSCGFKGRNPCRRCRAYTTMKPMKFIASAASA
jgi:hypothetical protein